MMSDKVLCNGNGKYVDDAADSNGNGHAMVNGVDDNEKIAGVYYSAKESTG